MPWDPNTIFSTQSPQAGSNGAKILQLWLAMQGGAKSAPTDGNGVPVANDVAARNEYFGNGGNGYTAGTGAMPTAQRSY